MRTIYAFGPFWLDPQANMLYRGTEPLALGRRAVTLLRVLVEHPGALVSKETLIDAAWPGLAIEDSNLTVQIAALRRALVGEPDGARWIETLPRRGYRFVGPVVTKEESDAVAGGQSATPAKITRAQPVPALARDRRDLPLVGSDVVRDADGRTTGAGNRPQSAFHAQGEVNARASGDGFGDTSKRAEHSALRDFRRTGWLSLAPGPHRNRYLAMALAALLGAFWVSVPRSHQKPVDASTYATAPEPTGKTSPLDIPIAILPFTTSLGSPPTGLGERIAHDLASHLPRSGTLRVVPSQSLRDAPPDFKGIDAKLGVRYVVTGTIDTQDEKLQVSAALIDARTGARAWALHIAEDRGQWLAVHNEFIHRATFAIHFQAVRRAGNEPVDATKEPTISQLLRRGQAGLLDNSNSPRYEEARAAFAEVLRREPESVPAMVGLAAYYLQLVADLKIDREPHLTEAEGLLRRALARGTHDHSVHYQLGRLHNLQANLTAALEAFDRVLEIYPSHMPSYAWKGRVLIRLQRSEEALKSIRYATRLNGGTIVPGWQLWIGWAELELGRDEEAREAFNSALAASPHFSYVHASLAALHALRGERDAARQHAVEMRKRTPQLTDEQRLIEFNKGPDNRALRNRLGEGLRLAIEMAGSPPDN